MISKAFVLASLTVLFGTANDSSAQILDGEYWKGTLSGPTRTLDFEATEGKGTNPAAITLTKGKLPKTTVYMRSTWMGGSNSYSLDIWTEASDGTWVERVGAGALEPFGAGFPDSQNAGLSMNVDLDPTPLEGGGANIVFVDGLVNLKVKPDKKNPGSQAFDEVQSIGLGGGTSGSYVLGFNGQTTMLIAAAADQSTVESALESLITIGEGNVSVSTPVDRDGFLVQFREGLGSQDVPLLTIENDTTDGTGVTVTEVTVGSPTVKPSVKSASVKLDKVGAFMEAEDVGSPGADNEVFGSPKFSAKRVREDQLPFGVPGPL